MISGLCVSKLDVPFVLFFAIPRNVDCMITIDDQEMRWVSSSKDKTVIAVVIHSPSKGLPTMMDELPEIHPATKSAIQSIHVLESFSIELI